MANINIFIKTPIMNHEFAKIQKYFIYFGDEMEFYVSLQYMEYALFEIVFRK